MKRDTIAPKRGRGCSDYGEGEKGGEWTAGPRLKSTSDMRSSSSKISDIGSEPPHNLSPHSEAAPP